jgi:hypothetical protein
LLGVNDFPCVNRDRFRDGNGNGIRLANIVRDIHNPGDRDGDLNILVNRDTSNNRDLNLLVEILRNPHRNIICNLNTDRDWAWHLNELLKRNANRTGHKNFHRDTHWAW